MYVKISNGSVSEYPYTKGHLRRDNPNTSFPKNMSDELLASYDMYEVTVESDPSYDIKTQKIVEATTPVLKDGTWTITRTVASKTADEIAEYDAAIAKANRTARDAKLAETDFYALSDVTMSAEMTTYRQALRDITAHANWPHLNDSDWPTKP